MTERRPVGSLLAAKDWEIPWSSAWEGAVLFASLTTLFDLGAKRCICGEGCRIRKDGDRDEEHW